MPICAQKQRSIQSLCKQTGGLSEKRCPFFIHSVRVIHDCIVTDWIDYDESILLALDGVAFCSAFIGPGCLVGLKGPRQAAAANARHAQCL